MSGGPGAVVLLEGESDVAAVRTAAETTGTDLSAVRLVDMGGITNVGAHLRALDVSGRADLPVLGMCDAGETRFVVGALERSGHRLGDAEDLSRAGFFVCVSDLEDELLRAVGTERAMAALERHGLADRVAALRQQPAWRGRPLHDQLHRFAGVASRRKALFATAMTAELAPEELPDPLRLLLDRLR